MSSAASRGRRERPIWKIVISALPVGVAVAAFLAVPWPWDLAAVLILVGIAVLLTPLMRQGTWTALGETLLLYAVLFLTMFTALGAYADANLPQAWLPAPVLVGCGAVAAGLAVTWVLLSKDRAS
jgi:hypothetical protein